MWRMMVRLGMVFREVSTLFPDEEGVRGLMVE
jgi:hypothetical protein